MDYVNLTEDGSPLLDKRFRVKFIGLRYTGDRAGLWWQVEHPPAQRLRAQ